MDPFASGVRVAPTTAVPDQKLVETSSGRPRTSEPRATFPGDARPIGVFA
jgi:hypothetical protein